MVAFLSRSPNVVGNRSRLGSLSLCFTLLMTSTYMMYMPFSRRLCDTATVVRLNATTTTSYSPLPPPRYPPPDLLTPHHFHPTVTYILLTLSQRPRRRVCGTSRAAVACVSRAEACVSRAESEGSPGAVGGVGGGRVLRGEWVNQGVISSFLQACGNAYVDQDCDLNEEMSTADI